MKALYKIGQTKNIEFVKSNMKKENFSLTSQWLDYLLKQQAVKLNRKKRALRFQACMLSIFCGCFLLIMYLNS